MLTKITGEMIEDILKEIGGPRADVDYLFFPTDRVVDTILQFAKTVIKHTKDYETYIANGNLDMAAKKLANHFSMSFPLVTQKETST